jgi:hypothetical protein
LYHPFHVVIPDFVRDPEPPTLRLWLWILTSVRMTG